MPIETTIDYAVLHRLLDRPIAFHRVFVTISGSVLAGLMLSQAFYWTPRGHGDDGWFYKKQAEWEAETGLTRWEQETARKKLLQMKSPTGAQVWQEQRRGVPAKLWYRVDIPALFECIFGYDIESAIKNVGSPQSEMLDDHNLERGKATGKSAENPQSFYTENRSEINAKKSLRPTHGRTKKRVDPDAPRPKYSDWNNP